MHLRYWCFLFFIIFIRLSAYPVESLDEYHLMDEIALRVGADKSSNYHDYTRVYSRYLEDIRLNPIRFMEIGIYKGNSVRLWEEYLPNAELHFIDINKSNIEYYSDRSQYHFINQENVKALQKFAKSLKGKFDVIIDDGGHTMKQQINSLIALFPFVKSGGMYIIEDLHTSYWYEFGGSGTAASPKADGGTTVGFLKKIIDDVNAVGAKSKKASFYNTPPFLYDKLTFWEKNVRSMHFYDSVCILIKR